MPKGSIRIAKLSYDPQIYAVAFVPLQDAMTGLSWRECNGLEEVRELLEAAGVDEDEIVSALGNVYQKSSASIRGVVLDQAALERLGLRIPSV